MRSPINPCSCNDPEVSDPGASAFLAGLPVNDEDLDKLDNPLARRYDILQPYDTYVKDRYLYPKGILQKVTFISRVLHDLFSLTQTETA